MIRADRHRQAGHGAAVVTRRIAALLLALLPLNAAAQQAWIPGSYDNGDFFFGTATLPDLSIALSCGERSPMRPDWRGPQDMHAMVTPPGVVQMRFARTLLGPPRDELGNETRDVSVIIGGLAYTLPPVTFGYHDDAWVVQLAATDPFFAALLQADDVQGQSLLGQFTVPTTGFQSAWMQLMAFCQGKFGDLGMGWATAPATTPAPAPQPPQAPVPQNDAMLEVAYAHVRQVCGRDPVKLGPGHLMIANIDGDGRNDIVIWWGAVDCGPPTPLPVCGAAQCLVETFLTAAWRGTPERVQAASAGIARGSHGLDLLQTTGRAAVCQDPASPPDCRFYWGWHQGRFQRVN